MKKHSELFDKASNKNLFKKSMNNLLKEYHGYEKIKPIAEKIDRNIYS